MSVTVTAFSIAHPGRTSVGPPLGCQDAPNTTHTLYQPSLNFIQISNCFTNPFSPPRKSPFRFPTHAAGLVVVSSAGYPGPGARCGQPLHYLVAKHWKNDLIFVGTYSWTKICKVPMLVTYLDILYIVHTIQSFHLPIHEFKITNKQADNQYEGCL